MPGSKPSCSAPLLDALVHKVHQHLGMDFSAQRSAELLRRLQLLAVEQQVSDPQAWLQALAFSEWDAALIQRLVPAFSVGETYFRRDPETFDWLAQHHLAGLLARRRQRGQRSLRLWSAGCCTGEEAYSLLFLLDELLGKERDSWTLELVASDISAQFLARAEQALYGSNAFRRNESAFRQRSMSRRYLATDRATAARKAGASPCALAKNRWRHKPPALVVVSSRRVRKSHSSGGFQGHETLPTPDIRQAGLWQTAARQPQASTQS